MSENIPFDIQSEIIKRIPVRSLIQFRSVSKAWKSHIDSSDFIARYRGHQQHLLVSYRLLSGSELRYVSFFDDDTFPRQNNDTLTLPPLVTTLKYPVIVGSSHGLLCLYGDYPKGRSRAPYFNGTGKVVLWNLSIRKAVAVIVPGVVISAPYRTILGFGVCRETNDPKILKILHCNKPSDRERVEVFTLSTGAWRSPLNNLPRESIRFRKSQVVMDGFLYWLAFDSIKMDGGGRMDYYNMIISIDMTSEEFRQVNHPDSLAHLSHDLSLSKLNESLVVLEPNVEPNNRVTSVWIMKDGVPKSFSKLFTVDVNTPQAFVTGFRKTAEPIIEIRKDKPVTSIAVYKSSLVVFEAYSKQLIKLGISGLFYPPYVCPYMETLLLLDQPDLIVYDKGKSYISK